MSNPIFYFETESGDTRKQKQPSQRKHSQSAALDLDSLDLDSSTTSSEELPDSAEDEEDDDLDIQAAAVSFGTPVEIIVPIHNVDLVSSHGRHQPLTDPGSTSSAMSSFSSASTSAHATQPTNHPPNHPKQTSSLFVAHDSSAVVSDSNRPGHRVGPADFQLLRVIGKGAYGKVFLVRKTNGQDRHQYYAMKVLRKAHIVLHQKDTEHTRNERNILEEVRHPFIVRLFYAFQTDSKLYLILDYAPGGELFMYLEKEKMLMEDVAQFYMAELILALQHLHRLGIIYRDLKPENVLLDGDGHVKLTDFGLSKVALSDDRANTVCGTVEYMAPEIIANLPYDKTVDWWSLGALSFDMMTGKPPFSSSNRKKTMDYIMNKKVSLPYYLTPDAKDLLTKLLRKRPDARLGRGEEDAEEIKRHRFFSRLDWQRLLDRGYPPPIKPTVTAPDDVANFHPSFTSLPVVDSPTFDSELAGHMHREVFRGFSYVAQSVLDDHFEKAQAARTLQRRTD